MMIMKNKSEEKRTMLLSLFEIESSSSSCWRRRWKNEGEREEKESDNKERSEEAS
jgi:hypothetical protein